MRFIVMSSDTGHSQLVDLRSEPIPFAATANDVTLYLYTHENKDDPETIKSLDINELVNSKYYNPQKMNVFMVHGWQGGYDTPAPQVVKNSLLEAFDENVFLVDWSQLASKFYLTSKASIPNLAKLLARFIQDLYTEFSLNGHNIRLIGHSLGAHFAGCIGKELNGTVDYILGLDPAGPGYTSQNTNERLDETDARFVQVIHTNGGMLGYKGQLGHADYYPNGGSKQTGCGTDLLGSCAHARSYEYFAESVEKSDFHARECESYDTYKNGHCKENAKSFMGQFHVNDK